MSNTRWDDPFLRSVAVLQTQCALLDQQADRLTELTDLQAHRQIRSDLANYIAAHARAGTLPADPLATLSSRLRQLSKFFNEAASLHRTSLNLKLRSSAPSLAAVQSTQANLKEAAAQLPAQLQALASLLSPLDWDSSNASASLHPELLLCAQALGVDLSKNPADRSAFRLLVLKGGHLFQEIESHFKEERSRLTGLAERHARHGEALRQAAAQIALDNHRTAGQLLTAAGLQESSNHFSDLGYATVRADLAALQRTAIEAVGFAKKVPANLREILERFQAVATTGNRVSHHAEARQKLAAIRHALDTHWTATMLPDSELKTECRPPLETAYSALDKAEAALDPMASAGKTKRRAMWITSGVIAAITTPLLLALFVPKLAAVVATLLLLALFVRKLIAKAAAKSKAASEKRMAWTGAAMRGAGFKAEQIQQALTKGGTVHAWGANNYGQSTVPSRLDNVVAIAAGVWHTVALKGDDTVHAWGANGSGQRTVPPKLKNVVAIAAGAYHTVAVKTDGTVHSWGENRSRQSTAPSRLTNVVAIAAGAYHTVALKSDCTVHAWGENGEGQCTIPYGLNNVVAIATGNGHTVALKTDVTIHAWGENGEGQCTVPSELTNVVAIAAGAHHTVALKKDGTVHAWGENGEGQCTIPYGLNNVVAIAAGAYHTVVLMSDGTVHAWGRNDEGQSTVPSGLNNVVAISAGFAHTVALTLPPK